MSGMYIFMMQQAKRPAVKAEDSMGLGGNTSLGVMPGQTAMALEVKQVLFHVISTKHNALAQTCLQQCNYSRIKISLPCMLSCRRTQAWPQQTFQ